MDYFNPLRPKKPELGSAGTGKSTLLSDFRVKDIPTALDRMWRFGFSDKPSDLSIQNLRAVNSSLWPSDNTKGQFITWLDDAKWGSGVPKTLDEVLASTAGIKELEASSFSVWFSDMRYTTSRGSEVGVPAVFDMPMLLPSATRAFIWVNPDDDQSSELSPDFVFVIIPTTFHFEYSKCDLEGYEVISVLKRQSSNFNGTGIPNQVVVEGMNQLPTRGISVSPRNAELPLITKFRSWASLASYDTLSNAVVKVLSALDSGQSIDSHDLILAFIRNNAVRDNINRIKVEQMIGDAWVVGSVNSPSAVALADSGIVDVPESFWEGSSQLALTPAELLKYLQQQRVSLAISVTDAVSTGAFGDGTMISYSVNGYSLVTKEFDPFIRCIAEPVGDTFVETLNQLIDVVRKNRDTAKANGTSSGLPRAMDLATGNSVHVLYTNRSPREDEAINSGALAGLQSGNVLFNWDADGEHIVLPIRHTHRVTQRDISHLWFDSLEDDAGAIYKIFVDTPQESKQRFVWVFNSNGDYIGNFELTNDMIEIADGAVPEYRHAGGPIPSRYEEWVYDNLAKIVIGLIKSMGDTPKE